jgi:hypothetical protein
MTHNAEYVRVFDYRYHVPTRHNVGDPPPPILLTMNGITEEVADYMGRSYLCEMATLGSMLDTCPGRLGRLARWIIRWAARNDGSVHDA